MNILKLMSIFYFFQSTHSFSLRPGSESMLMIGLYHQCGEEMNICQRAVEYSFKEKVEHWQDFLKENAFNNVNQILSMSDFEMRSLTFCQMEEALTLALQLKLNESFFVSNKSQNPPTWNNKEIPDQMFSSRIVLLVINAPLEISRVLQELFLKEGYVVWLTNPDIEMPQSLQNQNIRYNNNIFELNAQRMLHYIYWHANYHRFAHFLLLYIENADSILYKTDLEYIMKAIKVKRDRFKVCHKFFKLNITDSGNVKILLKEIWREDPPLIVVVASPKISWQFLKIYNKHLGKTKRRNGESLLLLDLNHPQQDFKTVEFYEKLLLFNKVVTFNRREFHDSLLDNFLRHHLAKSTSAKGLNNSALLTSYNCIMSFNNQLVQFALFVQILNNRLQFIKYYNFRSFKQYFIKKAMTETSSNKRNLRDIKIVSWAYKDYDRYIKFTVFTYLSKETYQIHICPIPECGRGKENQFGKLPSTRLGPWQNNSYGWYCQKCPVNYFQPDATRKKSICLKCPQYKLSSDSREACYDPYIDHFVAFDNQLGLKISLVFCAIGLCFSLFGMIIFIKYRSSVVVRGSNFPIMLAHISCNIAFFSFMTYRMFHTSNVTCLMELLVYSLLVFCPCVLIFIKSQNILQAFQSKLRLTTEMKRRSLITQTSTVLILSLASVSAVILSIHFTPISLQVEWFHHEYKRVSRCNISPHITIQFILIILQNAISTIQSYRGRNLPGPFNEAMSIVYSSFTNIVTCATYFPIQFLQKDKDIKEVARVLIMTTANLLFVVIFYGNKLYIILFKPEQNTKEYLQHEMFQLSKQKVESQMNRK